MDSSEIDEHEVDLVMIFVLLPRSIGGVVNISDFIKIENTNYTISLT